MSGPLLHEALFGSENPEKMLREFVVTIAAKTVEQLVLTRLDEALASRGKQVSELATQQLFGKKRVGDDGTAARCENGMWILFDSRCPGTYFAAASPQEAQLRSDLAWADSQRKAAREILVRLGNAIRPDGPAEDTSVTAQRLATLPDALRAVCVDVLRFLDEPF